jgi:hypothetical protein
MKGLSIVLLGFLLTFTVSDSIAQKRVGGKLLKGYDVIYPFKNGKAKVIKAGKVGYIDPTGEEIIKPEFDNIMPFEKGMARVELNLLVGLINEQGELLLEPIYESISNKRDNIFVLSRMGKKGLVKITGPSPDMVEYIVDIRD